MLPLSNKTARRMTTAEAAEAVEAAAGAAEVPITMDNLGGRCRDIRGFPPITDGEIAPSTEEKSILALIFQHLMEQPYWRLRKEPLFFPDIWAVTETRLSLAMEADYIPFMGITAAW